MLTKHRLAFVQSTSHLEILGATAWEHEYDRRLLALVRMGEDPTWLVVLQQRCRLFVRAAGQHPSLIKPMAPQHQRMRNVRQRDTRILAQPLGQALACIVERTPVARGEDERLGRFVRLGRCGSGWLLQQDECIGPTHAEGIHSGPARRRGRGPSRQRCSHLERTAFKGDGRIRSLEIQRRGNGAAFKGERGLDEARNAGGGVEVTDIRLHGADETIVRAIRRLAECLCQGSDLYGIAHRCRGAMTLDVADAVSGNSGYRNCFGDCSGLAIHARREITDFARAVVIDRTRLDHCVDVISVGQRIREATQHDDTGPAAEDRPLGAVVESAAVAVRRKDFAFLVVVADSMRDFDGDAARQCHVALA